MAGKVSVRRQPSMENRFVGLGHSYWRDRLPRGFKFYLDRLARSFVCVQPSNGPAFAMVLMEQLLAKRNDELEKLPKVSYLNILKAKEKLDRRACSCAQDMPQEEPADGESMVYVCRRCGRTSRQLQTPGPESESFKQPVEDASSKSTESTKGSTVVTFTRDTQTRDSVWDEGIQVNFGQDQATQVSGRLPDSPHHPESIIIFSPLPGPVFSPPPSPPPPRPSPRQPPPAPERLRPGVHKVDNVCTTCLVSALEEHARVELMHEDDAKDLCTFHSQASCKPVAAPVEDLCQCRPQATYKPAPVPVPATGTQWTQVSLGNEVQTQVSTEFTHFAQQEQYSPKPGNLKVGTPCPTCGERRTGASTPSTRSTPPPGICRACAESNDQGFKSVCRPKDSSASAAPRVAQGDAKYCPTCLPASEPYALLSPLQDQQGFRPVSGSQPVTRSEAPFSGQGYPSVCYDCMASEVEDRAFAKLKCEHPSFGRCVACEIERSTVRQSPPAISQPVPARLPSAHPTCACGCSPQQGFQPMLDPFLPANSQPMNTHRVQYSQKAKDTPPVCGPCVASAVEDRAFDELRLENPMQITCYHGGENRQGDSSTSPAARPTLQPSSNPFEILSPMPGENRTQTPVSKPLVVNTTVCASCIAEPKLEKPAYGKCVCETGMKPAPPQPVSRPPLANSATCGNCMASEVEALALAERKSENPSFGKGMVRQAEPNSRSFEPVRGIDNPPPVQNQGFRPMSEPVSSSPADKKAAPPNPTPSPVVLPPPEPYSIMSPVPADRPTSSDGGGGTRSRSPSIEKGHKCIACGYSSATPTGLMEKKGRARFASSDTTSTGHVENKGTAKPASSDRDSPGKKVTHERPPTTAPPQELPCTCDHRPPTRSQGVQSGGPTVPPTHPYTAVRDEIGSSSPVSDNPFSRSPQYQGEPLYHQVYRPVPSPGMPQFIQQQPCCPFCCRSGQSPMVPFPSPYSCGMYPPDLEAFGSATPPALFSPSVASTPLQYQQFQPVPKPSTPPPQQQQGFHESLASPHVCAFCSAKKEKEHGPPPDEYQVQVNQTPEPVMRPVMSPVQTERAVDKLTEYCILGALSSASPGPQPVRTPSPVIQQETECQCQRLVPRADSPATYTALSDLPDNLSRVTSPSPGQGVMPPLNVNVSVEMDSKLDSQQFMQEVRQQITDAMDQAMDCQRQALEFQRQCLAADQQVLRELQDATRPMICPPEEEPVRETPPPPREVSFAPVPQVSAPPCWSVPPEEENQPTQEPGSGLLGTQETEKKPWSLEEDTMAVTEHPRLVPVSLKTETVDDSHHTFSFCSPHIGNWQPGSTRNSVKEGVGTQNRSNAMEYPRKGLTDIVGPVSKKVAQDRGSTDSCHAVSMAQDVKWAKSDSNQLKNSKSFRNDGVAQVLKCKIQKKHRRCVKRTASYIDQHIFPDTVLSARHNWVFDWSLGYCVRHDCQSLMGKSKSKGYKLKPGTTACPGCFVRDRMSHFGSSLSGENDMKSFKNNQPDDTSINWTANPDDEHQRQKWCPVLSEMVITGSSRNPKDIAQCTNPSHHKHLFHSQQCNLHASTQSEAQQVPYIQSRDVLPVNPLNVVEQCTQPKEGQHIVSRLPSYKNCPKSSKKVKCRNLIHPPHQNNIQEFPASPEFPACIVRQNHHSNIHEKAYQIKCSAELEAKPVLNQTQGDVSEDFHLEKSPSISAGDWAAKQASCQQSILPNSQNQFAEYLHNQSGHFGFRSDTLIPSTMRKDKYDLKKDILLVQIGDWSEECFDQRKSKYESDHRKCVESPRQDSQKALETITADRFCNLASSLKQSELFFEQFCNISSTHLLNYRLAEHQARPECASLNNSLKWRCVPANRNEKYTHHSDQRIKNEPPRNLCLNSVPLEDCEKCRVTLQSEDVCMELSSVPFEECHLCFSTKQNEDLQKATENHFLKLAVDKKMLVKDCGVQTGTNFRENNSQKSDKIRDVENEGVFSMMYWEPQDTVAFIQDILLEILQNTLEITDSLSVMDTEDRNNDVHSQENRLPSFLRYLPESKVRDINMPGKDCCPVYIKESPENVLERTDQRESDTNNIPTVNIMLGLGHKKITAKREHNFRGKTGICELRRTVDSKSLYPNSTGYQHPKMFSPLTGHYGVSTSDVRAEAHDLAFQTRSARSSSVHESSQTLPVLETAPKMLDLRGLLMRTVSPNLLHNLVPIGGDESFKATIMDRSASLQLAESHVADNVILKTEIPVCQPCKMELESQSYKFATKEPLPCEPEECVFMSSSLPETLLDFQGISTSTTNDRVQADPFSSYSQSPVGSLRENTTLHTNTSNVLTKLGELYVSEVYPLIDSFNRALVFFTSLFREYPDIRLSEAQCICIAMLKAFGLESKRKTIPRNTGLLSLFLDCHEEEYAPPHCRYSFQNLEESCFCEGNVNYAYGHEHILTPCIQTTFYADAALSESNTNTSARSNSPVSFEDDQQDEKSLSNSLTVTNMEMQINTSDISDSCRSNQTAPSPGQKTQTCKGAQNSSFSQWYGIRGGFSSQSSVSENYNHAKSVEKQSVESCSSGCNSTVSFDRYRGSLKSQYTRCLQEPSSEHHHNKNNVSAGERRHTEKQGSPHEMRQTLLDLPCHSLTPAGVQRVTDWLEDNGDEDDGVMSCVSSSTITQLQISPQPSSEQLSTSGSDADPVISSSDVVCPDEEQALRQHELCELTDFVALEMVFQEEELQQTHPNQNHNTKRYTGVKRHQERAVLDILPTSETALWKNDHQVEQVGNVKKLEHVAKLRKLRELSELADFVALENAVQKQNHLKEQGCEFQNRESSSDKCHDFSEQSLWPLDSIPEEDEELEDQELSERSPFSDIDQTAEGQSSRSARPTQCRKDNTLGTELHQLSYDGDAERADSAVMSQDRTIEVGRHAAGLRLNGKQDRNPQLSTCNKTSTLHKMKGLHSKCTTVDHSTDGVSQNQAVIASRAGPVSDDDDDGVDQPRLGLPVVSTIQRGHSCMSHDCSSSPVAPNKKTKLPSNTVDVTKPGEGLLDSGFESGDISWVSAPNSAILRECCGSLESSVNTCNESLCRSDPDKQVMSGKRTIQKGNEMFLSCEKETESQNAKRSTLVHHGQTRTQEAARNYPESTVLAHCRPEVLPRSKQTIATVSKAVSLVPAVGSKTLCTSPDCSHKTSPVQSTESGESGPETGLWRKDTCVSKVGRLSSAIKALVHRRWKKCYISDESVAAGYIVRKKTRYHFSEDTPKIKLKESNKKTSIKQAPDDSQLSQNWSQLNDLVISKIIKMDPSKLNSSTNRPASVSVSSEMSIEEGSRSKRKSIETDFKRANTEKLENQSNAWKDVERDSGPITPATLKAATQNNSMKETELYLDITTAYDRESLVRKSYTRQLQKFHKREESSIKNIDHRKSECLLESRKSAIRKCDAATSAGTKSQPLVSRSKECVMVAQETSYFKLSQKDKPANCRSVIDEDYLQTAEKSSEVSKTNRTDSDNKPVSLSMNKPSRSEDSRSVYNASVHSLSSSDMSVGDEHFWSNCEAISLDNYNSDWTEGQTNQNDMKDQPEVQTSNHKTVKVQTISGRNCSKQGGKSVSETNAQPVHNKHGCTLMDANDCVGRFYRELLAVVSDELDSDGCNSTSAESLYTQELEFQKDDPRNVQNACPRKSRKHQLNRSKIDTNNTDSLQEIANLHRHVSGKLDLQHQRKSSQPIYQPDNTCESHYYNTQYNSTVCREASTGAPPLGIAMTSNWSAQKLDCKMLQRTADHAVTNDTCSSAHSALASLCHHVDGSENPLSGYIRHRSGFGKRKGENAERGPVGLLRKFFTKRKGDTVGPK